MKLIQFSREKNLLVEILDLNPITSVVVGSVLMVGVIVYEAFVRKPKNTKLP